MQFKIHHGDCVDVLKAMPENSVDAIVCDPPYGLRFMAKHWDYDIPTVAAWHACLRVLKPGGYLLAFAGTRTHHRMTVNIEDAGFEIQDMIAWVYGSGMPKHQSRLKPAIEPITMARKPANKATRLNIDACRVEGRERTEYGLQNSRRTRVVTFGEPSESADFDSSKGRYPANLIHDGSEEVLELFPDSDGAGPSLPNVKITGYGDGAVGSGESLYFGGPRRPFNSGSGSAARFFYCAKANKKDRNQGCEGVSTWESVALNQEIHSVLSLAKDMSEGITYLPDDNECNTMLCGNSTTAQYQKDTTFIISTVSRLITALKTSNFSQNSTTRENILVAIRTLTADGSSLVESAGSINQLIPNTTSEKTASVLGAVSALLITLSQIKEKGKLGNIHSTVKPTDLMRYLCRLVTPPGGTVLDPFMGSGSTGKAAILEGFRFVGIEREAEYIDIAHARILYAQIQAFDEELSKESDVL